MEEYLKTVLSQIRCKKACPYIEEELRAHIMDQKEANLANGMDEEMAEHEAVKEMGDPVATGISLDRIHKPKIAWGLVALIAMISLFGIIVHKYMCLKYGNIQDGIMIANSSKYTVSVLLGFVVMIVIYCLDYTRIAFLAKVLATVINLFLVACILFGAEINGVTSTLYIAGIPISILVIMLLYVPIYGAVIYHYREMSYDGLIKCILWMVIPVGLTMKLPNFLLAMVLYVSMLVQLLLAITKNWFRVSKKKANAGILCIMILLPAIMIWLTLNFHFLGEFYEQRLLSYSIQTQNPDFLCTYYRSMIQSSVMFGMNETCLNANGIFMENDYILTYLISHYGVFVGIIACLMLAALILCMFRAMMKQKNQLGMVMGCGCGMILIINAISFIFENLGWMQRTQSFFPFLSAGHNYVIISYALLGIVLSIYKYKNVYPEKISMKSYYVKLGVKGGVRCH